MATVATHTVYMAFPQVQAERIFYVMRGLEGVILFVCLAYFTFRPTTRRVPTGVLFLSCVFGAYQELMTAICGAPLVFNRDLSFPLVRPLDGLCGAVTGLPLGLAEAILLVVSALYFAAVRYGRSQHSH